jgi:hypothetical protein
MKYDLLDLITVAFATVTGALVSPGVAIVCAISAVASIAFWQRVMNRA